jgi:hypothetical protein
LIISDCTSSLFMQNGEIFQGNNFLIAFFKT